VGFILFGLGTSLGSFAVFFLLLDGEASDGSFGPVIARRWDEMVGGKGILAAGFSDSVVPSVRSFSTAFHVEMAFARRNGVSRQRALDGV